MHAEDVSERCVRFCCRCTASVPDRFHSWYSGKHAPYMAELCPLGFCWNQTPGSARVDKCTDPGPNRIRNVRHDRAHLYCPWPVRKDSPAPNIAGLQLLLIPRSPDIRHRQRSVQPPAPDSLSPDRASESSDNCHFARSPHLQPQSTDSHDPQQPARCSQIFCRLGISSPALPHPAAAGYPPVFHPIVSTAIGSAPAVAPFAATLRATGTRALAFLLAGSVP